MMLLLCLYIANSSLSFGDKFTWCSVKMTSCWCWLCLWVKWLCYWCYIIDLLTMRHLWLLIVDNRIIRSALLRNVWGELRLLRRLLEHSELLVRWVECILLITIWWWISDTCIHWNHDMASLNKMWLPGDWHLLGNIVSSLRLSFEFSCSDIHTRSCWCIQFRSVHFDFRFRSRFFFITLFELFH